jgi:hypothetical protein
MSEILSKSYIGLNLKWPLFLQDFNKTLIFLTFKKNTHIIKFHESPSSGSRLVACGRTDRHDEANSRFSWFCKCA